MNNPKRTIKGRVILLFTSGGTVFFVYINQIIYERTDVTISKQPLIRVTCKSKGEKIGLVNYADLVVFDKDKTIVALRIGGYPESVQAMSDIITVGCDLDLEGARETISVSTKGQRKYERRFSHDGIYAESMLYLKDDVPNTIMIGEDEKNQSTKVAVKKNLYFFCKNSDELYADLDRKLSVPLIPEFKEYMLSELKRRSILNELKVYSLGYKFSGWHMNISADEKEVAEVLEDGIKTGKIQIPGVINGDVSVFRKIHSFTEYLHTFGSMVADKIKECFIPRFNPAEEAVSDKIREVNDCVRQHAGYSLFDAQLGAAEALKRQLEHDKMALLVAECGTGKTKIGSAALYAYQHSNPKRKTNNKAFNVVICPSHITGKWVREIHETIPNSAAMHVTCMSEVDTLYEYYKKENKNVYCILSKETARNGYMRKPSVVWNPIKKGFVCPHCGHVQEMSVIADGVKYVVNADASFFLNENSKNHKCQNHDCKEVLWSMLNPKDLAPERNDWVRIGSYGFIHRKFTDKAYAECKSATASAKIADVIDNPNGIFPAPGAFDRYPLSAYIKKKLRRIDGLIIDELHQYSGESAQGQAMAELAGISDKVIGMTATLINGYAKGIFYLLFRLKSHLMLMDNQSYKNPKEFCYQYGVVEELFSVTKESGYNSTSKAVKSKVREKFLPGISPIVYTRFLLENAVFLSLADMGKELPDYEEIPLYCKLSDEVESEYRRLEGEFKKLMTKNKAVANRITSAYMNLLSAYPDQPYDHEPIYNPFWETKEEALIAPINIGNSDVLQPKDEKVIELVERKIAAGEKVIIYTAWTRLDSQDKLFKALNEKGIPTVILKPTVKTTDREEWVDKKLQSGVKVLITNPALVETGLDLNAFTTLIFYNIAYNLYIFRQASRRSWRINQTAPKVEVYMFYYKDTMQQRALRLMASKLSAATVIEGNISEEGLAAMSNCEDLTTQLAKELVSGLKENVEELSSSFKKMAILGNKTEQKETTPTADITVIAPALQVVASSESATIPNTPQTKTNSNHYDTGQMSLFDLVA